MKPLVAIALLFTLAGCRKPPDLTPVAEAAGDVLNPNGRKREAEVAEKASETANQAAQTAQHAAQTAKEAADAAETVVKAAQKIANTATQGTPTPVPNPKH